MKKRLISKKIERWSRRTQIRQKMLETLPKKIISKKNPTNNKLMTIMAAHFLSMSEY